MIDWLRSLPVDADSLAHAVAIQQHVAPKDWAAQIERVPAQHRASVEKYLRQIARRLRSKRLARAC